MDDNRLTGISRRGLLGSSLAAAGALALAACGSSNPSAGSSTTQAAGTTSAPAGGSGGSTASGGSSVVASAPAGKRGGTLRFADTDGGAADVDPHGSTALLSVVRSMYDGLVEPDRSFKMTNALAEVFEPENGDPKTWIIKVRDGVKFHNGKTLGADDVEFTIRRILDPKNPRAAAVLIGDIDLDKIEKVDTRTLRLHLKAANSQLREGFAPDYASIVPVGFDPKTPAGTGAFKQVSFTPNQRWTGARFDDYWRVAGGAYLDQLDIIVFATTSAALNAILAGQVDVVSKLMPVHLQQIKTRPQIKTVESETGLIPYVSMNARKGQQFEDPRVRQAFRLMVDREQLINTVFAGHGAVGNDVGVFPQWDSAVAPDLPERKRDVEKAKALLKEAGKENMTVKLRVGPRIPGLVESAQVLQQQAKDIGVTIELNMVNDTATWWSKDYFDAELQVDKTTTISMYSGCTYFWLGKAAYNSGGYDNSKVNALFEQAITKTGDDYDTVMREMSHLLYDDGPWIVWGRQNLFDAHLDKVQGIQPDPGGVSANGNRFWELSLA